MKRDTKTQTTKVDPEGDVVIESPWRSTIRKHHPRKPGDINYEPPHARVRATETPPRPEPRILVQDVQPKTPRTPVRTFPLPPTPARGDTRNIPYAAYPPTVAASPPHKTRGTRSSGPVHNLIDESNLAINRRTTEMNTDVVMSSGRNLARRARRGGYRKRKSYAAYNGYKHLRVFQDPFSNASLTPRIPDGKSIVSTGLKYHFRDTFELGGSGANTNEASIILTPSLTSPCAINFHNDNDESWFVFNAEDLAARNGTTKPTQQSSQEIYKWRVVGYGLHISLLSNTDNNAGWWEAGRISTLTSADNYHFFHADGKPFIVYPKHAIFDQEAKTMVNHPSYTTGRLRDIHNVTFQLLPDGNEHDFVVCEPSVDTTGSTNLSTTNLMVNDKSNIVQGKTYPAGSAAGQTAIKSHVDLGWDSVFVRIYGTASSTAPSQILLHVVQNVELVYDERATMARFQSRSPGIHNFETHSKNKSKQTASAKLVKAKP